MSMCVRVCICEYLCVGAHVCVYMRVCVCVWACVSDRLLDLCAAGLLVETGVYEEGSGEGLSESAQ